MGIVIKNGTVISPTGRIAQDVLIEGEVEILAPRVRNQLRHTQKPLPTAVAFDRIGIDIGSDDGLVGDDL